MDDQQPTAGRVPSPLHLLLALGNVMLCSRIVFEGPVCSGWTTLRPTAQ